MKRAEVAKARQLIGPPITDVPGEPADSTQIERLVERYHWTARYCTGRDVLEVACGGGQGLGLLRARARAVWACDLSRENLATASRTYGREVPLAQAEAESLPFRDASLDVIVLLEAIYFLRDANAFMSEARRVLRRGGLCLLSAVNKDCPDFNPTHSLYSRCYGIIELAQLLADHGFVPECSGIIPMDKPSLRRRLFKPLKNFAVRAHLIPETMRARRYLKRIVFGKLDPMPANIIDLPQPTETPTRLRTDEPDTVHQVILCAGMLE
jgi:ubiquinone/menaquinone biosynthesis C-methylase UbiE